MRFTNIAPVLIASLLAQEVNPFGLFRNNKIGTRRRSSLKSTDDKLPFFSSPAVEEVVIEEIVDVSVPYDAAAKLAYGSSGKTMCFERFRTIYLERAVESVKSKRPGYVPTAPSDPIDISVPYDAAARLSYEASETRLPFVAYKKVYVEDVVNMVARKNKERKKKTMMGAKDTITPKPPISSPPVPNVKADKKFSQMLASVEKGKGEVLEKIAGVMKNVEFVSTLATVSDRCWSWHGIIFQTLIFFRFCRNNQNCKREFRSSP